jgi:hypothetical protein
MKKLYAIGILLTCATCTYAMDRDPRLSPKGQHEYFKAIPQLIHEEKFDEAHERITFLRTAARKYVSDNRLDELEATLARTQKDRELQQQLLTDYDHIRPTVFEARDYKNIEIERTLLHTLWNIGKKLQVKPSDHADNMTRLYQIEEYETPRERQEDQLLVDLIDYLRQSDGIAQEAFIIMHYGNTTHGRCTFPFNKLFEEAKEAHAKGLLERSRDILSFLMHVGNEELRQRSEIFLAIGEDRADIFATHNESAQQESYSPTSSTPETHSNNREQMYLTQADGNIYLAYELAFYNNDHESAAHLSQLMEDEALAQSLH